MYGQFRAVSISYKNAPLNIREQIALNEDECKALMLKLQETFGIIESIVLSTCNRTEVYYMTQGESTADVVKLLAAQKAIPSEEILPYAELIDNQEDAVQYLFEVALGLHSQVVGDLQIPNQIKNAYQWSADLNFSGPFLHRLLHAIFFVNKRVVQETAFRDGAASTSYAAIETIETFLPLLNNPKILVVGLGEIGKDVALTLGNKGYENITLTNRTKAKAEELAEQLNFNVSDFEAVENHILESDIVISSVRLESPLVTKALLKKQSRSTVQYFIDLSVPRSIDPEIEQLDGVVVYDLDEIQQRANEALERRLAAVPDVKAIIADAIGDFNDWSKEMVVSPTIHKLKNALEQIRKEEVARYAKKLNDEELKKVEQVTRSMMQKIIKLPVLQLKAACKRDEAETLIDVLNDLFNLEKDVVKNRE
ncbi:MAG: glutamyl-tRNA reductase [Spirosomaceae bacterium]|nr:glutamyl-tRNA reductase [Spirosomataceae bacterium]